MCEKSSRTATILIRASDSSQTIRLDAKAVDRLAASDMATELLKDAPHSGPMNAAIELLAAFAHSQPYSDGGFAQEAIAAIAFWTVREGVSTDEFEQVLSALRMFGTALILTVTREEVGFEVVTHAPEGTRH